MCYNSCQYSLFNPVSGIGRCVRGKNNCPEEEIECEECGKLIHENDICEYGYDYLVCKNCFDELTEKEEEE